VRIIIAAHTDVPIVHLASRSLYGRLLRAGVRIFEWKGDTILHAKTAVADGYWSTVGSANLDALSLHSNLETNAVIEDGHFSSHLEQLFHEDLAHCEEVTWAAWQRRSWAEKTLSHIAYQLRLWL